MPIRLRPALAALALALLAACAGGPEAPAPQVSRGLHPNETPELRALIEEYSRAYGVPEDLVHRVVIRESRHVPAARNGPYYGLMQIHPQTARTMGYQGPPSGLLDAETNLKYAVKYLRGAWLVADGDRDEAVGWYARGYYYEAKRRGLLEETELR
jgi:soluble lytic murein transglycosylase-like protein